jgi:predicted lipoprotein with Yx(FWY)xxD motif
VACFVAFAGLSACSSSNSTTPRFSGPVYEIGTTSLSGLGDALVDGQGFTLYLYEPDAQSGHSRCSGPCAVEWSPLTVPNGTLPISGPGARSSLLSTTHRSDGTTQVTYNGWPLYTWAEDMAPGQATGEGLDNLGGLWFVLNSSGNAIKKIGSGST